MTTVKPKKKLFKKLKNKYRLIIYNDKTYEELWSVRLSRLNVFTIIGMLSIILVILTTIIIAFTPLREYIPGYPNAEFRAELIMTSLKVDSLEYQLHLKDQFLGNIRTIIEGEEPRIHQAKKDSSKKPVNVKFTKDIEDSIFRVQVEEEEKYSLTVSNKSNADDEGLYKTHFYAPVKGVLTNRFNIGEGHNGIDIIAKSKEYVSATLDGTIIFSSWTFEAGYVVHIQHSSNLVSVYKHNARLLKKDGQKVKAGEPIAIFGDSGEFSSGPHLHFELWHKGKPVNPELYISFN
jgi:murein DD-endopeptidase MepM/ murein hydrolase activator NlpD